MNSNQNQLYFPLAICDDCLKILPHIPEKSIDMILCDFPYNITNNSWECSIPMEDYIMIDENLVTFTEFNEALWQPRKRKKYKSIESLFSYSMNDIIKFWEENKHPGIWTHYKRIIKLRGIIILFGAGKFSSQLMNTGKDLYKYNLVWEKKRPTNFLNANRMPLRSHEDILIFYKKPPVYHPQKSTGHSPINNYIKHNSDGTNYGKTKIGIRGGGSTERFPTTIWKFSSDTQKSALHTTQKPLALCEELIKTFSNEGSVILDNCAGSFTTAVACDNLNRQWIAIEKDKSNFEIGLKRINDNRINLGLPILERINYDCKDMAYQSRLCQ